jgi:Chaperone of endosialidase
MSTSFLGPSRKGANAMTLGSFPARPVLLIAAAIAVLAPASAAQAAFLTLGTTNTSNAPTILTGASAGPELKVVNANTSNHAILAQAGGGSGIALYGQHTTTAGTGPALRGDSASTAANAFSIYGLLSSTAPGSPSAAVRGQSNSTSATGYGVWGSQAGSGVGVYGTSALGTGLYGRHTAASGSGPGVQGDSASSLAAGVVGKNTAGGPGLQAIVNAGVPPLSVNSQKEVTNLNADLLDGLDNAAFWQLHGNKSTSPGTDFLGTIDNQPLELKVNGQRALRLEPTTGTPNLIGGFAGNSVVGAATSGATIAGGGMSGSPNSVAASWGAIGGGIHNLVGALAATIAGGVDNLANHIGATVSGGGSNTASGIDTVVAGGSSNTASGDSSTVAGGSSNTASGDFSTVAGGYSNLASGEASVVAGGFSNHAGGAGSFAAGSRARALDDGSFVWADDQGFDIGSNGTNTFTARTTGGARFISAIDGTTGAPTAGVTLAAGGGSWSNLSDRNAKERFTPVDEQALLRRLARVPISRWSYKAQGPSIRHLGPTAQDFSRAFGLGEDNKHITTVDSEGVALAAIQGLYRQNQALEGQNRALNARLTKLERAVGKLSRR